MSKIKVLYVDDEVVNLLAFEASFRRDFDVFTARSADEGLNILKENSIEVVLSDQKMPEKTGVDFFELIVKLYPNPIRILITGFSNVKDVIDAINKGEVYRYINKPWHNFELKQTIKNAYELYQLKEKNKNLNLKYREIFYASSDSILLVNKQDEIFDYNLATLKLLETNDDGVSLSSFNSIFDKNEKAKVFMNTLEKENCIDNYECQLLTLTGEKKHCLISGAVIKNTYNEFLNYQFIIKDITQRTKNNQLLLNKIIETQEEERARIARDLHDGIGQSLSALGLHLESLKINYGDKKEFDNQADIISGMLKESIAELRRVCYSALPNALYEFGLVKAIQELETSIFSEKFSITFEYDANFPILVSALEISIYRIIQEFINNSIKHSGAKNVFIELRNDHENIYLTLKDNGVGFDLSNKKKFKGSGLKNIQNRIDSFKGTIKMKSIKGKGLVYDVTYPILSK